MAEKRSNDFTSVKGFIHEVSPVKISRKNNAYFNAKLQTQDDVLPIVCYSPQKRHSFVNAQTLKSAVEITNIRLSPGKLTTDIHANQSTNVVSLRETLPFTRKANVETTIKDAIDITITDVKLQDVNQVNKYNIKGKVVHKTEIKTASIHGEMKSFQDITIHDGNDSIEVSLFEHLTDKVNLNTSYKISNLKVRIYTTIKLTSTRETSLQPIEEEFDIPACFDVSKSESLSGHVISARIIVKTNCPACQKNIINFENNQHLLTCPTCQTRVKKSALITQTTALLQIKDIDKTEKITCPHHALLDLLQSKSKLHLIRNKTDLEDYFLDDDIKFNLVFDNNKVVTNITQI